MEAPELKEMHKDLLLARLFYDMSMEKRRQLMRELPEAYNAYCGQHIVSVVRTGQVPKVGVEII